MADPLVLSNGVPRARIVTFGKVDGGPWHRLDVAGGDPHDGTPVIQWEVAFPDRDPDNQRFAIIPCGYVSDGHDTATTFLIGTFSGRVLDVDHNGGAGTRVWTWEANYGPAQVWVIEDAKTGKALGLGDIFDRQVRIALASNRALVMDVAGDNVPGPALTVNDRALNGTNQVFELERTA